MTPTTQLDRDLSIDEGFLKAIGHPVRFRILEELNERAASPSELADTLSMPVQRVAYHFSVLQKQDAIEFVGTRPSSGALKRVYRATARPLVDDARWAHLPQSVRNALFGSILDGLWRHVVEGAQAGGFDDPQSHASWTAIDVDREGYQEIAAILEEVVGRVLDVQARAANRLAALPEAERHTERTELAIMHYHRPRDGETEPARQRPPETQHEPEPERKRRRPRLPRLRV